jgi:ubiquinone/menaquinone biosynthesis C-methylase UbiE
VALERWAPSLPAGGRVADVGCGAGRATRWLEAHGFSVLSVDLSTEMLRRTRAGRPRAPAALADMRALPSARGGFDGLAAFFSLTHIPKSEAPAVLGEFRRILKPAGGLLVAIVAGEDEGEETTDWAGGHALHFSAFTRPELAGLLASAGFTVSGLQTGESHFHGQPEKHLYMFARAA